MTVIACAGAWACSSSSGTVASRGAATGGAAAMGSGGAVGSAISARVRRLTNAEYDATVQALLDTQQAPSARFVPDARLYKFAKFERNEAQVVEPVLARQLQQAAQSLASEYVTTKLPLALPCLRDADTACARSFFESFLPRAYRRAVSEAELDRLLSLVVTPAIARDGFQSAIALGIEAALQSSAFLYHSELGPEGALGEGVTLTNREVAEALSYLFTGAPADAELAQRSDLAVPERREAEARRLLQSPAAKQQVRRLVKQWLEIDSVAGTSKNKSKFPVYQPDVFDQESNDFVDEVVFERRGGLALLLGADFTLGRAELAGFYGVPAPSSEKGLIDLAGVPRRGILNLGAFLATFATPEFASPIKRGARFLTQVLCLDPGDPNALNLRVMLPPFDSSKTTRQRFEQHSQGACASCHALIDSVGFGFQHFNAIGAWQANEDDDPERPIDSSTRLPAALGLGERTLGDSAELSVLASQSDVARRCFARNLARFVGASYGSATERAFLDEWQQLSEAGRDSVQEVLVAYVKSRFFVERAREGTP